jgi:hypothetical protein
VDCFRNVFFLNGSERVARFQPWANPYYVGLEHKGKTVALLINAPVRQFEVWEGTTLLKKLTIKGVQGAPMELSQFHCLDA